ncbi:MAG TPA: FtsX-like permease family protein [Bacteroidia bacterium]|jgi:lipoprotein-releasing system permease protein|nr:FtsX-like permease family protein [Bacteroidia bacterium]
MNLSLFIAKRYLVSKKSHNAINIISGVALGGIAIGTMALIIILSVFNGISDLVKTLYNSAGADIEITAAKGKTFLPTGPKFDSVKHLKGVKYFDETMQDRALLKYGDKQCLAYIKGVGDAFAPMTHFDTLIREGKYSLQNGDIAGGEFGRGVADQLGINSSEQNFTSVTCYAPKRGIDNSSINPEDAITQKHLYRSGIFSINDDFDGKYVIVSVGFARKLFDYQDNSVSSIEIGLDNPSESAGVKEQMKALLGSNYLVKDRLEQNELLFKTLKSEKLGTFIILAFILLIATFNIVGSLSMLIIDKQKDIAILRNMGAEIKTVQNIFMYEGILITLVGTAIGLLLGSIVCLAQIKFKLVPMSGNFVVDAYPVSLQVNDYLVTIVWVLVIGFLASWYPVKVFTAKKVAA